MAARVSRTASTGGSAYERMRAEALDIEAGVAASEGPARRAARRLHLPPLQRWLRGLCHAEARVLSREELEAHLDDYCELLALLDLYLELVPEPMSALRAGGAAAAAEARKLRAGARSSDTALPLPSEDEDTADVQAMLLEDVLVGLAKALHSAGSPVWRLEFNLSAVARGLGLPGTQFAVFPSFILVTFSRLLSRGHGGKTLYIPTSPGLNMTKLDAVDALARRVAAYATNTPTPFREKAGAEAAAAAAAVAALCSGPEMRRRSAEARSRFCGDAAAGGAEALGRAILELASAGPGFFMYSKHLGGSLGAGADEAEDEGWGDGTARGGSLYDGNAAAPASLPTSSANGGTSPPAEADGAAAHAHSPQDPPRTPRSAPGSPRRRARYHRRRDAFLALALDDALEALRGIEAAKPLYPAWAQVLAMGVASAGCALAFFAGGWWDALLAGVLGGLVGALGSIASAAGTRFVRAYEFLAAALTAALARLAHSALRPACLPTVMLSALIWLVQGWTMTNAIVELATRNPISGTSHLFVGVCTTAMLGFGLDAGSALADILGARQTAGACGAGVSPLAYVPLFVPTTLSFSLLLNADRSQLGIMTLLACVAFGASAACALAPRAQQLAPFLAAAVVGVGGNAYANATGRPAMAGTMSGIFILVPGAMALRSVATSLLSDGDASGGSGPVGLALTSRVLTVAVSIGAGLFMASLILPPREMLHVRRKAHQAAQAAQGPAARMHGGYTRMLSLAPVNM